MIKRLLIISSVLFTISLFGVYITFGLPEQVKTQTTQVRYEHSGKFSYVATLKPSYLFGPEPAPAPPATPLSNLKYPAASVDRFQFTFDYRFLPGTAVKNISEATEVTAVGKNAAGKESRITLAPRTTVSGESSTVKFDLAMGSDFSGGNITIQIEVYPTVQLENGIIFDSFTQTVNILLKGDLLEVERASLSRSESGYLGSLSYQQEGKVGYVVILKTVADTGNITLAPVPALSATPALPAKTAGTGETIFTRLVDKLDFSFEYQLNTDRPIREQNEEITITAILENPGVWSKNLVLVPTARKTGNFKVSFPLDINKIMQTLEAIRNETGVVADSYNLVIRADVHVTGQSDYGKIDEVFNPALSTALGKGTIEWKEKLVQTKTKSIETSRTVPNPNKYLGLSVNGVRNTSIALACLFLAGVAFFIVLYRRSGSTVLSEVEKETAQVSKKYAELMVEASPPSPAGDRVITLRSMEDLIKVADELGRPVIHQPRAGAAGTHAYYVFDGGTQYQYVIGTISKQEGTTSNGEPPPP